MKIPGFPWTIRTRLTLLYAGAFFLAGVALIVFIYLYLGQVLERQFVIRLGAGTNIPGPPPMVDGADTNILRVLVRQARLDTLQTMLLVSLLLVVVMSGIAAIIGWLVAGHALQPLRNITATARRVADRSLHERIALDGPEDEIKNLADTLDEMLERLDRSFDSQRRFVANASHELRTPLTIARTLIEVALLDSNTDGKTRQLGSTLLAVNRRHEKLTDGLLTLASSEQRSADFHRVDIGDIADHAIAELRPMADKVGIRLQAELGSGTVMADAPLIERLIQNLVENGIQYNAPDGWVRIRTGADESSVELVVENTGPVIAAHEVPGLFEPFRRRSATERLAGAAPGLAVRGAGLGLSIVRAVAQLHGGDVQATPREGGGLIVRVRIPAAA